MPPSLPLAVGARFPTRQYPYRARSPGAVLSEEPEPLQGIAAGAVVRFFLGADEAPVELPQGVILQSVNDPFAMLVLARGHRPLTLLDTLAIVNIATGADAVPGQRIYRVADGGQIPWSDSTAALDRHLRIVVTRHRGEEAEMFIATAPPFISERIFLQIFAWDPKLGAYNFYERRRGGWSWAGSSWQALEDATRGLGPFDSHVNGAPVMKELKLPWMHRHSQSSQIRDDILAPNDPLRTDALYNSADLRGGEDLELIVRAGTARWTRSRFERRTTNGCLVRGKELLRHVLTTTTVNLVCSPQPSASLTDSDTLRLPTTFFINSDCLIDELALPAALVRAKASAAFYRACLVSHAVQLVDGETSLAHDTYFAFPVPEPSFEDRMVLRALLARGALSRRLALCLLMLDFPNPVFSEARSGLLRYTPEELRLDGGGDLDERFSAAVRSAVATTGAKSPEARFLALWDTPDEERDAAFAARVEQYWTAVQARLISNDGFDAFFRLAESRRRQFRNRPIAEFGLTLPVATRIDVPPFLEMTENAAVRPT